MWSGRGGNVFVRRYVSRLLGRTDCLFKQGRFDWIKFNSIGGKRLRRKAKRELPDYGYAECGRRGGGEDAQFIRCAIVVP